MTCKEETPHIPCWSATPVFQKPSYSLPDGGQGKENEAVKDVELSSILSSSSSPPGSTCRDQASKALGNARPSQQCHQYPRRGLWRRIPTFSTSTLRTVAEIVIVLCSISVGVIIIVRVLFSGVTQNVTQLAMLKGAEVSRIDAYMVSFMRAAQKLQTTWALEAFGSSMDLNLTHTGPGVDTYLMHMLTSSKGTRSVVVATEDTWTGAFYDTGGAGMLVGVANTTCLITYRLNEATQRREGGAPYSVTCPFDAKTWYYDRIGTTELNKTSLALDPFTNRVGLIYTAKQSGTPRPMVVVSYLDTAGLGRQLQRYSDLAFESETNQPRSMTSHWDGVSIFLFTTYEPYYIVATSTAKTQALLEGDTIYDASSIPNPHISSAVKTIMTSPLSTIHEEAKAFVSSAPVEGDLYLGVTVSHAHVYRYEADSLEKVYLATCIMVLILGIYSSRRYWLPPLYRRMRALMTAAGALLRLPSKDQPDHMSEEELRTSDTKSPSVSARFLTAFIACIFIVNTMVMVYKLEAVVRIKESLRFRHNTQVVADLVHDVTEGAVRTLDYATFMTQQGFVPVRSELDDDAAILQTFLVSVVQHAHEANSVEILEVGFSDGRVEAAVYYTVTGDNEELAVISNGELAGNVYTIFKPEMIGKNTSTEDYIFKNPTYNLYDRPWYKSTHGQSGLCYNEPFLWYSSHEYGVSWGKEVVNSDWSYVMQSGIFLNQISGYLREITLAKDDGRNGDTIFIMSGANKALLASSSSNTQRDVCGVAETITPDQSFSAGVNRTYSALTTRFGEPKNWPKTISPFLTGGDSTLGPMFVSVTTLDGIGDSFMDWSLVLSSPYSSYYEVSRGVEIVVILISGIIILLTFANIQLAKLTALRQVPVMDRVQQSDPFVEPTNDDYLVKEFIKQQAQFHKPFKERYNRGFDSLQHALDYIGLSTKGVDLWTFLRLEERKAWQKKLFYIHRSSGWNTFILLVLFGHCALAFVEAPCRTTISDADLDFYYQLKLFLVRVICLVFLWIDSLAEILNEGLYVETLVKGLKGGELQYRLSKTLNIRLVFIILILTFMLCDYLMGMTTLYTTQGLSERLSFFMPISTFLRPILATLRIPEIFLAAKRFLITTYRSLPTMTLILVILLVCAVSNVILFKGDIETTGLLQGRTFDNLINSLVQTTLFVLTQSNFQIATAVVNCPLGPTGYYSNGCPKAVSYLYFTFISSIGYIVFLAVMVMAFQLEYFKLARAEATKARSRERVAYIAAFLLIEDDEGKVSGWTLRSFFKKVEKRFDYPIHVKIYDSDAVTLEEFVDLMEQFHPYMEARTRFLKHEHASARSSSGTWRLCQLGLQYCYSDSLQYCVLVIGLTTSALYGLVNVEYSDIIYTINLIFFIYFFLETTLRICVAGFINFWYVPHDVFKESNNRYNLILNVASLLIILFTVSLGQFGNVASRVILFMPMLRILCAMRWMRILFLAVIRILFKIFWLSIFGLLVFYFYAIFGIFLYAGSYQDFIEYNQTYSLFNFNSLADALWTLWACFVSSAISPVFLASIDAGEIFYSVLYFLSFIIFFRLVFMRILVAVLVDSYRRIDSIIARSPHGVISTFEFWRSMKEEGRLEEGRWVKIRVHADEEGNGANFFEVTFSKKGDAMIENSRRFRTREVDWSTVSEHVRWLSNCSSGLATDGVSGESRREILDCIEQWEADLQLLKDNLSKSTT